MGADVLSAPKQTEIISGNTINEQEEMISKVRQGNHLYVYHNGKLVYKRWYKGKSTKKAQPSLLYNVNGWPNVWIS